MIIFILNIVEKALAITTDPLFTRWPVGTETCSDTERYNKINKKLSVAISGKIFTCTQQDAPRKDKTPFKFISDDNLYLSEDSNILHGP
jgi:hypothetical protein